MMRRILALLTVPAILALLALAVFLPAESPATAPVFTAPSAAPTYPACVEEDGYGMALCMWDGVLSGDCAPAYVGGYEVSALCVNIHAMPSSEHEYQGATITVPNGADLVGECVQEWNTIDPEVAKAEGFTLENCFKAQIGM